MLVLFIYFLFVNRNFYVYLHTNGGFFCFSLSDATKNAPNLFMEKAANINANAKMVQSKCCVASSEVVYFCVPVAT